MKKAHSIQTPNPRERMEDVAKSVSTNRRNDNNNTNSGNQEP